MEKKVGIPRALFFYKYYPFWKTFFNELGAKVVVSDKTSKSILNDGVRSCVDEACLAVKLFYGHVINLKDRVDYLLIPRFTSVSQNEFVCPKFGGLPDMIRNTIPGLPQIIDTEVNMRKSRKNSLKSALEVGSIFSQDKSRIKKAYIIALQEHKKFRDAQRNGILDPEQYPFAREKPPIKKTDENLKVAVIGHVYNLYDSFINMDMLKKLSKMGVHFETAEMYRRRDIAANTAILEKRFFWDFGTTAMGYALEIIKKQNVGGIIYIMTFGCGIDSFVCDLIERKVRNNTDIPFIVLTIDEHSGEAGINTRLEAFIDMIRFKQIKETSLNANNILANRV